MKIERCPEAMLFDLDGTLAHTLPQLGIAAGKAAEAMGYRAPSPEEMANFVGNGVRMLLCRVIAGRHDVSVEETDPAALEKMYGYFAKFYAEGLSENFEVYPGVREGLEYFRSLKIRLAVITNKPHVFAEPLIGFMGLSDLFDAVLGGEVLPKRKPDPMPLVHVLDALKVKAEDAVMVGDSLNDVRAGVSAGCMSTVAFTYGYDGGYDIRDGNPDHVFERFSQLTDLIRSVSMKRKDA